MSEIPAELRYTKSHEWIRVMDDGHLEIGITDHAQAQLGDMVFVELHDVGTTVDEGDDCAVVRITPTTAWLLTMDSLIENVHFGCSWHPPRLLGRKTVSVNISDIAAMAGTPRFILLSALRSMLSALKIPQFAIPHNP